MKIIIIASLFFVLWIVNRMTGFIYLLFEACGFGCVNLYCCVFGHKWKSVPHAEYSSLSLEDCHLEEAYCERCKLKKNQGSPFQKIAM